MIRRPHKEGWLMITQPTHAWSAGQMARVWGNDTLIAPSPTEAVYIATSLHDIGWSEWDAQPRLAADGYPVNFMNTTINQARDFWKRAALHLQQFDPYAALLLSIHAVVILGLRMKHGADSPLSVTEIERTIHEFQQLQEQLKETLQKHPLYAGALDEARIQANYRILRSCDMLCLALCEKALEAGTIPDVPGSSVDERVTIAYNPQNAFTLALKPYPFNVPELKIRIPGRYVGKKTYTNNRLFQDDFNNADWEVLEFTLTAGA